MLIIIGFILGAGLGVYRARQRGGAIPDLLQYGAAHGIAFAIIGAAITVLILRLSA